MYVAAGVLVALAAGTCCRREQNPPPAPPREGRASSSPFPGGKGVGGLGSPTNPHAFRDIRQAYLIVFLASFGGMTLELTASRVLAVQLGVSLFTWTGSSV